jgi:hypothetical protein
LSCLKHSYERVKVRVYDETGIALPLSAGLFVISISARASSRAGLEGQRRTTADFKGRLMPIRYALGLSLAFHEGTGEGGIRTLGSLLGYGALAKRCFQPLSHLTKSSGREYRQELLIANFQLPLD